MHFVCFLHYFCLNAHSIDLPMEGFCNNNRLRSPRRRHQQKRHRGQIFGIRRLDIVKIEHIEATSFIKSDTTRRHRITVGRQFHLQSNRKPVDFFKPGERSRPDSTSAHTRINRKVLDIYETIEMPCCDETCGDAVRQ